MNPPCNALTYTNENFCMEAPSDHKNKILRMKSHNKYFYVFVLLTITFLTCN